MRQKNPYRIVGSVFTAIAAVEVIIVLIVLGLAISGISIETIIALPFGIQSLVFGTIGITFLVYDHRKRANRERLLANGYYEMATIAAIEQNPYVRVNRNHPYHVICRIERDGVIHEYRSEGFYHLPAVNIGDPVPVYLDRQNEKNYHVDVESIAPAVIRH